MSRFLTRYEDDPSRPSVGSALRDLAVRAALPAVGQFAAIVAIGWVILGPLGGLPQESRINASIQQGRTPVWDMVTKVWSMIGNTEIIIGTCLVVVALVWWRTRQWWYAVIPGIAISLQASIFVAAAAITGRTRPDVAHLDPAPPTSSYPSGHVGATTALYLTVALLAHRIAAQWARRLISAACLLLPVLVAYARLYRGMHQLLDVVVGMLNGVGCALLAWAYLRRERPGEPPVGASRSHAGISGPRERVDGIGGETERDHEKDQGAQRQAGQ